MKKSKKEKQKGNLPSKKQTANCLFCIKLRLKNKKNVSFSVASYRTGVIFFILPREDGFGKQAYYRDFE